MATRSGAAMCLQCAATRSTMRSKIWPEVNQLSEERCMVSKMVGRMNEVTSQVRAKDENNRTSARG